MRREPTVDFARLCGSCQKPRSSFCPGRAEKNEIDSICALYEGCRLPDYQAHTCTASNADHFGCYAINRARLAMLLVFRCTSLFKQPNALTRKIGSYLSQNNRPGVFLKLSLSGMVRLSATILCVVTSVGVIAFFLWQQPITLPFVHMLCLT